jgi:hypothetical protein
MRRKVLQDVANTLCQMLVAWRMADDLEKLSVLPDGVLEIDVLAARAAHNTAGPIDLWIAGELSAWTHARFTSLSIPLGEVQEVMVRARFQTDRVATNRKKIVSFDWHCDSVVRTSEKSYLGKLAEKHVWHRRVAT